MSSKLRLEIADASANKTFNPQLLISRVIKHCLICSFLTLDTSIYQMNKCGRIPQILVIQHHKFEHDKGLIQRKDFVHVKLNAAIVLLGKTQINTHLLCSHYQAEVTQSWFFCLNATNLIFYFLGTVWTQKYDLITNQTRATFLDWIHPIR